MMVPDSADALPPSDQVCPRCNGTGRAPARTPINWTLIINAIAAAIITIISSLTLKYADSADANAGAAAIHAEKATKQSEKNGEAVKRVEQEQQKRFYMPKKE